MLRTRADMDELLEGLTPFRTSSDGDPLAQGALSAETRLVEGRTRTSLVRAGFWTSFVALPLAAAACAYATAPSRRLRRSRPVGAAAATAVGIALVRWQLDGRFSEEPPYQAEGRVGDLEVRRYASTVVAETTLAGADWDEAVATGFRRLASYISGRNAKRARIELTPPVHLVSKSRPLERGEKIAMTAPVTVAEHAGGHTVSFVMPPGRTQASLPVPLDNRIQLRELPPRRIAVLGFAGRYDWESVRARMRELLAKVARAGWHTEGEAHFGGYDPPWTLPWLRRNEVWVEIVP